MKIAHFIPSFGPINKGGAEIHVHSVCKMLNEKGHEAILITIENNYLDVERLPYRIVFIKKFVSRLLKYLPVLGKIVLYNVLRQIQHKHKFDLWQITAGYRFSVYSVAFFNKHKIPCILRCAGEDINTFPEIGYGYRLDPKFDALVKQYYPRYDALIALTPSVKKEYLNINIPEEKIHVIPNGIDFNRFQKIKKQDNIRSRYSCKSGTTLILTVGRHHTIKGYKYIPAIAEFLLKKDIDFRWVIIGAKFEAFNQQFPNAKTLNIFTIQSSTSINGPIDDLPPGALVEYYKTADIFVFPSLLETFGMVLVEAMAAALPIVTTNAPGINDVIEEGLTGMKVPIREPRLMAEKILEILNNEKLKVELGNNALKKAKEFYDWDIVLQKYLNLYHALLK